jgi:hypothetical protein
VGTMKNNDPSLIEADRGALKKGAEASAERSQ